jgi:DUF177 domain-containing protein
MLSYNVADLLRSEPGSSERFEVVMTELAIAEDVRLARPITGHVRLSQSGRGILVRGHLDTVLAQSCSRCLNPAEAPVSVDFEEEALPSVDPESGAALDPTDEPEVLRLDDHHELDLEATVRAAISLAEPIAPLCRPDCPGLCVTCGADLATEVGHAHDVDDIDPRLAALAGLRDRLQ